MLSWVCCSALVKIVVVSEFVALLDYFRDLAAARLGETVLSFDGWLSAQARSRVVDEFLNGCGMFCARGPLQPEKYNKKGNYISKKHFGRGARTSAFTKRCALLAFMCRRSRRVKDKGGCREREEGS